jgi:hypothetical protein
VSLRANSVWVVLNAPQAVRVADNFVVRVPGQKNPSPQTSQVPLVVLVAFHQYPGAHQQERPAFFTT